MAGSRRLTVAAAGDGDPGPGAGASGASARSWADYLADFHERRPGITEEVLGHARLGDLSPYGWLAEAIPEAPGRPVLDLACGSGPVAPLVPGPWVGVDASEAELAAARGRQAGPMVRADGRALPLGPASVSSVACSMALMLMWPVGAVLGEVARVLVPGGRLVALLPARRPLSPGDVVRYARILAALRQRSLRYPNDNALEQPGPILAAAGLRLVADERARFACTITTPEVGVLCVRSLYLPGVDPARRAAAEQVARRWAGRELGLPLRRLVAVRA